MNGFVRYTHNENGEYKNLPEWKDTELDADYIHILDSKPKTLKQILEAVKNYNSQFNESDGWFVEDEYEILCSLVSMLEFDMIKVVKIDG